MNKILKIIIKVFFVFNLWIIFILLVFRFINPVTSAFMLSNNSEEISSLFISDIKYKPTELSKISIYVPLSVIASEDQRFFDHFGFDFKQIEKAIKENEYRRIKRGASTITMQVAKNLFLVPSKNILRKGLEVYYTLLIELLWSKSRIIEVYLNIAEMGKGIYGIEAASLYYYKKKAIKLNKIEAATIAAILPNPRKRNPAKPSSYVLYRRSKIMQQMDLIGGVNFIKSKL